MPTYTHQASGRSRRVPLSASTADAAGPYGWRDDCPVHGIHTDLDLDPEDLQVETVGMEWRLRDGYSVSMCGDCASEYRGTKVPTVADDAAVAREMVQQNWRHIRGAFEPAYLEAAGDLEYCPFCGKELVNAGHAGEHREREILCEQHGRITLTVRQLEELMARA